CEETAWPRLARLLEPRTPRPSPRAAFDLERPLEDVLEVTPHRALRGPRLPAADRAEDRPVLPQDRVAVDGRPHPRHEQRLEDVERPAGERPQKLVAGGSGDLAVEAGV